ncbi:MAG: enolase C-terminal domain-like protein [Hyphomicrobiales bacterium]
MPRPELLLTGFKIRIANVPLKRPVISRVGAFEDWAFICLDIETSQGIIGRSYIAPYLINHAGAIAVSMRALLEPLIETKIAPVTAFDDGLKRISLMGKTGIALYALAAIDMALWDAHAQAAGAPLAEHLGGTLAPVKAYNSSGLWLSAVETLAKEADDLLSEGKFSAVKLRFGRAERREDLAAALVVLDSVEPGISVMSDFNQGLTYSEALHRLKMLDDLGLYWFEEPVAYHDLANCAALTQRTKTPITIGENFHGPRDMHEALRQNACDMVMPDVMRIGGVTGWLRSKAIAAEHGMDVSSHLFPEISSHLLRVTPNADWLEWTDWAEPILAHPFEIEHGNVVIPNVPGTGISWNEKTLERYAA